MVQQPPSTELFFKIANPVTVRAATMGDVSFRFLTWFDAAKTLPRIGFAATWLRFVASFLSPRRAAMGKAAKGGKKLPSAPLADKKKKAKKRHGNSSVLPGLR